MMDSVVFMRQCHAFLDYPSYNSIKCVTFESIGFASSQRSVHILQSMFIFSQGVKILFRGL